MDRKDFLKNASAATALAFFGLSLESCSSDSEDTDPNPNPGGGGNEVSFNLTDSPFNALASDGGWLLHPDENILLVNVGGTISAFSSRCTHTGCTRDWSFPSSQFQCNCHGSRFDTSGNVTVGPASSPLLRKTVTRDGDKVTVS
jgi:thiosulfate dehydrogenase [quinone] large subunit